VVGTNTLLLVNEDDQQFTYTFNDYGSKGILITPTDHASKLQIHVEDPTLILQREIDFKWYEA